MFVYIGPTQCHTKFAGGLGLIGALRHLKIDGKGQDPVITTQVHMACWKEMLVGGGKLMLHAIEAKIEWAS